MQYICKLCHNYMEYWADNDYGVLIIAQAKNCFANYYQFKKILHTSPTVNVIL